MASSSLEHLLADHAGKAAGRLAAGATPTIQQKNRTSAARRGASTSLRLRGCVAP